MILSCQSAREYYDSWTMQTLKEWTGLSSGPRHLEKACRSCCPNVLNSMWDLGLPHLYLYNTNSVCVCVRACERASERACVRACVCLSRIGGQTAGPIMTKFGTYMRIDLGMVPT